MTRVGWVVIIFSLFLWPFGLIVTHTGFEPPRPIAITDYQAQQLIVRNTYLYPSVILARTFQNKLNIPANKFKDNLFSLLDPGYYFFGSHPRELYDQQNRVRLPYVALIFLVYGLYYFEKLKNQRLLGVLFFLALVLLSLIQNFSLFDIVLWPMVSYVIWHGYRLMLKDHILLISLITPILFLVSLAEYLRILLIK